MRVACLRRFVNLLGIEMQSKEEESVILRRPNTTVALSGSQQSVGLVTAAGRRPVVLQVLSGSATSQNESLSLKKV